MGNGVFLKNEPIVHNTYIYAIFLSFQQWIRQNTRTSHEDSIMGFIFLSSANFIISRVKVNGKLEKNENKNALFILNIWISELLTIIVLKLNKSDFRPVGMS